jgi:hypothetical protein
MPISKRKFTQWTYVDEVTSREHKIQVFTVINDEKVSFLAEVRTPMSFTDQDENANTLRSRVFVRCADGTKVTWTSYILVTINKDGFLKDFFAPNQGRRAATTNILIEGFEIAMQSDGTQVWRGTEGRSSRFSAQVKPGWPSLGKTDRGFVYHMLDTPENRTRLQAAIDEFGGNNYKCLCETLKQLTPKNQTTGSQEDPCPGPNSASTATRVPASTVC